MFGFLAAVGLAIGVAALLIFIAATGELATTQCHARPAQRQMVQRFDSYLFRSRAARSPPRPRPRSTGSRNSLAPLQQTLERIPDLDPEAQDARRLMSIHLPGLIDRYLHVPQRLSHRSATARA